MKRLFASLAIVAVVGIGIAACSQPAAAPAPTAAPAAPTKAAAPTQAAVSAPAPTAAPAKKVDFPEKGKAITIIVGVAAGGGADTAARLVAAGLEKELGTPVQVVNKPGAGTQVGMTELVRSKPDGYTLGWTQLPTLIITYLDPERKAVFGVKDFAPIANIVGDPNAIAVKKGKFNTLKDFIDAAKAKPESIKVTSIGVKGVGPLTVDKLAQLAGVKFAYVSMDSIPEQASAVLGGHLDAVLAGIGAFRPYVKSGEASYLAMTGTRQSKFFPEVPLMESFGYKIDWLTYQGLSAPAGTPKEVVDILANGTKKVIQGDDVVKKFDEMTLTVDFKDSAQYATFWQQTEREIAPLVR